MLFNRATSKPPAPAAARAPAAPAANKPNVAVREGAPAPRIKTFSDIPPYSRLLSIGDKPTVQLSKEDSRHVAVVELTGGKNALILHCKAGDTLLHSLTGQLRSAQYSVRVADADPAVIAELTKASAGQDGHTRVANEYMQVAHELLAYAVANRATDIHLEIRGTAGRVRFRIDGYMEAMRTEGHGEYPAAFLEKVMMQLFNSEQQKKSNNSPLFSKDNFDYCMIPYSDIPGNDLKLRFQGFRGAEGPKVVLRLLPVGDQQKARTFEELGYAPSQIQIWNEVMQTPSGMCFIAGVTGSGKSSTLKTWVDLNPYSEQCAVYTVEDPVEYSMKAHQIPIQRDLADPVGSARAYGEAAAAIVRGDNDIVIVGEIRDRISANSAQQFAETGAMALGTLHAHLLSGMVPRLVNPEIGMNRETLTGPNTLSLLAYQALVPRLCPHCAMHLPEAVAKDPLIKTIAGHMAAIQVDAQPLRWKRVGGCDKCSQRGTVGLTVVAEMLMPDDDWLRAVRKGDDAEAAAVYSSYSNGDLKSIEMTGKTVFEHTLHKALLGNVDARECARFDLWSRYVRRQKLGASQRTTAAN
ncbi:GspE/PulE family protein [Variovorax sp. LT1P1]|uniref:GspE/PulE family protein n=1 Tax=Variovorax sp. LT1P1 TaxID=3443730 RepID=UPI003F48A219